MNPVAPLRRFAPLLVLSLALFTLPACVGFGGTGTAPQAAASAPRAGVRTLAPEFYGRKAVAYSGYRGADHDTPPTEAQVLQDLRLLVQGGFGLIRMFSADDFDTGVVLRTIREHKLDLKMQLGIWIAGPKATHDTANQAQMAQGIALAKAYPDIVLAVSVGNETMVDWSLHIPAADMAGYIRTVRDAVAQPVTTDENWAVFANEGGKYDPARIYPLIDYVALHTYPLLDSVYMPHFTAWKHEALPESQRAAAMADTMIAKAKADYAAVQATMRRLGHDLPIVIGETGWKAFGPQADRIHPANQKMYVDRLAAWKDGPKQIFYFEAFDEPWKGDDDGWGLFDVNRKARCVVHALYPPELRDGSSCDPSAAVYWKGP
ncbi:MAG: glycosyl hydrolase family 17 protein [Pseudomonadota bacterium]